MATSVMHGPCPWLDGYELDTLERRSSKTESLLHLRISCSCQDTQVHSHKTVEIMFRALIVLGSTQSLLVPNGSALALQLSFLAISFTTFLRIYETITEPGKMGPRYQPPPFIPDI